MAADGPNNDLLRTIRAEDFHGKATEVYVHRKTWKVVNSKVDFVQENNPFFVSLGSSQKRERLFFNTKSKTFLALKQKARALSEDQLDNQNVQTILEKINRLVDSLTAQPGKDRKEVEKNLGSKLSDFLDEKKARLSSNAELDVCMDELIDKKILVCRHKALIVAFLLADLVKQGILPKGTVRQYRSGLKHSKDKHKMGTHTWAVYRDFTNGHLWHVDPRWLVVCNVNTHEKDLREYGDETISMMIARLKKLDCHYYFANRIKQKLFAESIVDAIGYEEGFLMPYPYVWLQITSDSIAVEALRLALKKQKIKIYREYEWVWIIKCDDDSNLHKFDFDRFVMDYRIIKQEKSSALLEKEKGKGKEEQEQEQEQEILVDGKSYDFCGDLSETLQISRDEKLAKKLSLMFEEEKQREEERHKLERARQEEEDEKYARELSFKI